MKLSIDSLKQSGGFVSTDPVERVVKWSHGGEDFEATVYVVPMSYHTATADMTTHASGGEVVAARISRCIVDEEGKPVFSVGDITGEADPERGPLNDALTFALLEVIGEVSGLGKTSKTRSPRKKNSGAS